MKQNRVNEMVKKVFAVRTGDNVANFGVVARINRVGPYKLELVTSEGFSTLMFNDDEVVTV